MSLRAAIMQPGVAKNGRNRVILGFVRVLNDAGIVPEFWTFEPEGARAGRLADYFGQRVEFTTRALPRPRACPTESYTLRFNLLARRALRHYDVVVNSTNSLLGLRPLRRMITYFHFPRRARVRSDFRSLHQPEAGQAAGLTREWLYRSAFRLLYRAERPAGFAILANSQFTRDAVRAGRPAWPEVRVVYPPVSLEGVWSSETEREPMVVSLAHFGPDKRQLDQVHLAQRCPGLRFVLMGFGDDGGYADRCRSEAARLGLGNVRVADDRPYHEVVALLRRARYFVHTMMNEPFGIAVVEGIGAGCIPVVHDSGGVREIVPDPALRFTTLDQAAEALRRLEAVPSLGPLRAGLQDHVRGFDESVFRAEIKRLVDGYLGGRSGS